MQDAITVRKAVPELTVVPEPFSRLYCMGEGSNSPPQSGRVSHDDGFDMLLLGLLDFRQQQKEADILRQSFQYIQHSVPGAVVQSYTGKSADKQPALVRVVSGNQSASTTRNGRHMLAASWPQMQGQGKVRMQPCGGTWWQSCSDTPPVGM